MPLMTNKRLAPYLGRSNFSLNTNINDFFGLNFSNDFGATESFFQTPIPANQTFTNTQINISAGAHDAIITITMRLDGSNTAKVVTIPASAGAALYEETTVINAVKNEFVSYKIEGGGGTGTTTMRGFAQGTQI